MKVKSNIRAGAGANSGGVTDPAGSVSSSVNSGGVNSNKRVYVAPVGRCVGI